MSNIETTETELTPERFLELINPHLEIISRLIRFRISNSADWDDVLQNTLLCAWRAMPKLRDRDALKPWLLRICGNCCHMHLRSRIRRENFQAAIQTEPTIMHRIASGRNQGDVTINAQLEVGKLLGQLSDSERKLLLDYYFKGLRVADIAARENQPEGTIKRRLHACRSRLRSFLETPGETETKGKSNE